jgi:hypothetical protein
LALALHVQEDASRSIPVDWRGHFRAALLALELSETMEEHGGSGALGGTDFGVTIPELEDLTRDLPGITQPELAAAAELLESDAGEMRRRAENHLENARRRNPLYERLDSLEQAAAGIR